MTRRFPLLLALVIVVAVLLVAGAVVLREDADAPSLQDALALGDPSAPLTLPTPDAEPTEVPVEAMAVTVGLGETATISGRVPDDATRSAVLDAVGAALPDADVVDQLSVTATVVPDGAQATLTGNLDSVETADALTQALTALGFEVVNQVTVGGQAASVAGVLDTDPRLGRFRELVAEAGVQERLSGEGPITVFAPTDDAFATLDPAVAELLTDSDRLETFLLGHVVDGEVFAADLSVPQELTLATGDTVALAGDGSLDGATVLEGDVLAANGVVHVIDAVLLSGAIRTEIAVNDLVAAQPVQFGAGSAQLVPGSTAVLDAIAQLLIESPDTLVEVQGHTDTDGEADDNQALSQARAEAVATYLEALGVTPERITAVGLGETRLRVDPEVTPEDKAANRRIEFRVSRPDPPDDEPAADGEAADDGAPAADDGADGG